jgi:hypothetical protein
MSSAGQLAINQRLPVGQIDLESSDDYVDPTFLAVATELDRLIGNV